MKITEPLRLAVGSHKAGSGKGCAMNVLSWESGDSTITDLPDCADPFLAKVVQRVNDRHCTHRAGSDLLCPPCSLEVLALAHRTVGTALDWPAEKRTRVHVEIAVERAESVLDLTADDRPRAACALVRRFLADEVVSGSELAAAIAAAKAAANAAAKAAYQLATAHHIIDRFEALTGIKAAPVAPEITEAAVAAMRG
jgi:hypothetical protein